MPFLKLNFRPGINRDQTSYSGEGGWYECDKIRFFSGYPQKLGGWQKASPYFYFGTSRQLFNWITSYNDNLLAVGTNNHVYIEAGGQFYNITPIQRSVVTSMQLSGVSAVGSVEGGTIIPGRGLSGVSSTGSVGSVGSVSPANISVPIYGVSADGSSGIVAT